MAELKGLIIGILIRFSGKNSSDICTFKVLISLLVLSLGKNVFILEVKST